MSVNIHIYPSPFKNESRILKETKSIINLKIVEKIIVLATWERGLKEEEEIDEHRKVIRIKTIWNSFPKNIIFELLKFFSFYLIVFFKYKKIKPTYVNAHSLSILPLAVFLSSKITKVIYDAHELETERNRLHGFRKKIAKYIERKFISRVYKVIVVSQSIADWYNKNYNGLQCFVLKNFPEIKTITSNENFDLKKELAINSSDLLFIYQGVVGPGRGVEILLDVFTKVNPTKHIVFMGFGPHEDLIKAYAKKHTNIHFKTAVTPEKIIQYSSTADVGISLIENTCLSYYYCLPNKVFEYLVAELPIVVSNFPEMKSVVENDNLGWTVNVNTVEMVELINSINSEKVLLLKNNVKNNRDKFNWKNQELLLAKVYS